jgi:tetratricopeptide (TPR) repeat protein
VAKTLTEHSGRRGKRPDSRERELKRLRLSVCDDIGFRLYLATYDQPKRRDELIARVIHDAEAEKVRVERLDLGEAGRETNLVGLLRAQLDKTKLPADWRQAVMVTGIEERLDYSAGPKGYAFLHQANLLRDALPEAAPVPVVLWLSRMASGVLPAEAPDLWHWRAANFDFTGDEAPRLELLRELATLRPEEEDGLSGEQRRARVTMLKDLLAELECEGLPTTRRQQTERAKILVQLGREEFLLGRAVEAVPRLERALEIIRRIGHRQAERLVLIALGSTSRALNDSEKSIGCYERALAIAREIGDRRGESETLGSLGRSWVTRKEPRRAIEYYEQSLRIARQIGDLAQEGRTLSNLGHAYAELGELRRAIEHYGQHLAIAREIRDRRGEAATLRHLGDVYDKLDEAVRAVEHYNQSLVIAREIGDRQSEALALVGLGVAHIALGETPRALENFERALAIAREIDHRPIESLCLSASALAFGELGDRAEAIERISAAIPIYEEIGLQDLVDAARASLTKWQGEDVGGELPENQARVPGRE